MLRSLLVAIDATKASEAAQKLAIDLAIRLGAKIDALAVLDKPWIDQPRARPIGTGYYHEHRAETLRKSIGEKLHGLIDAFEEQCLKSGVSFNLIEKSGAPVGTIECEAQGNDLILAGKDTTFHFAGHTSPSDTVMRLVRDNPRPTILTAPGSMGGNGVLIAYDGSLPASRALHMFILLGLGHNQDLTLLCIDEDQKIARRHTADAMALLNNHGLTAKVLCEATSDHPGQVILDHSNDISMVVMGAFSRNHLRDYFFGSTSQKIIDRCRVPLFIHH